MFTTAEFWAGVCFGFMCLLVFALLVAYICYRVGDRTIKQKQEHEKELMKMTPPHLSGLASSLLPSDN